MSSQFNPVTPTPEPAVGPPTPSPQVLAPPERWTLRDLVLFILFVPVALLAAQLIALAEYIALKPLMGWHVPERSLAEDPFFLLVLQSIFYVFVLGFIYLLVVIHYREPFWSSLGWRRPNIGQALAAVFGGVGLAVAVRFIPPVLPDTQTFPLERLFVSPAASYAVGGFAILLAPMMEELIFRGLLFVILERRVGLRFAVAVTAVLFAGLHVPEYWHAWNHVLMIFVVGMVFSLARGISGSLAPSVFLHMTYNLCMMTGLFFSTERFRNLGEILLR